MKKYIRYIYEPNEMDKEKLRFKLNRLGFYVLNSSYGLEVYAVEDRKDLLDRLIDKLTLWLVRGK